MIVTCPACSSRYRIKDEKIKGRGAKISCPKCDHKFVVHREADPADDARGVPVTFARGGKKIKKDLDEDDEADVPTTVMPHGSQVAQQIKAAAASFDAQPPRPTFDRAAAHASATARNDRPVSAAIPRVEIDLGQDDVAPARQLRAKAKAGQAAAPAAGGFPAGLAVGGAVVILVLVAVALKFTGVV